MKLWFCYKKVFWKKKLNCNCSLLLFSKSHFVLCTTKYTFKESLKNKLICYCPSHYTVHLFNYCFHGQLTIFISFLPPELILKNQWKCNAKVCFFWDQNQDMSSRGFPPKKKPLIGSSISSTNLAVSYLNSCPESDFRKNWL